MIEDDLMTRSVVELDVVKGLQHGQPMYVSVIEAKDLARLYETKTAVVDVWSAANLNGYQRLPSQARARSFGRYVSNGVSPTNILMYIREAGNGIAEKSGKLTIPLPPEGTEAKSPLLYIVDGQHRTYGISEALREGWLDGGTDLEIPVTILVGQAGRSPSDPLLEEAMQFVTINSESKRVRTDLANQTILRLQASKSEKIRRTTRIPSGLTVDDQGPYSTAVTNMLAEDPSSAWAGLIARPNVQRNTTGMPSQGQFEDALLDNYLGVGSVISWASGAGLTVGELCDVVSHYWKAVFELCPDSIASPNDHVLAKTAGIHSVNALLPALFAARRALPKVPSKDEFKSVLKTMGNSFTDEYWESGGEDAAAVGTGKKSFKILAKALLDSLP